MKFRFKVQPYQSAAVEAVVDCFKGQPRLDGLAYRIDPGSRRQVSAFEEGFRNAGLIPSGQIFENVAEVQRTQNLHLSRSLTDDFATYGPRGKSAPVAASYRNAALEASDVHLDVEMETGTGKTYCYIKTIFEMNKRYGWSKFIIMTPSIAIREGIYKSLQITADHFAESYSKKARFFIYNSRRLHELESFSSDAGINVMVINIQAFNSRGAENRRIYEELDDFQSRKPIDVIATNRPILILDEPQKMEGKATMNALPEFKPLFILRYSATHRTRHNLVHRLDAMDAYQQKLVKKISVRGIRTRGLPGTNAYLYLEGIDISKNAPVARVEMEEKMKSGVIKRKLRRLKFRDDLFAISGDLEQYRGFTISQIDYVTDTVEFTNGVVLKAGEAAGDVSEPHFRRIQIRETIRAHLEREKQLYAHGIKVLSLFFIDAVAKYRDYDQDDEKGEYARVFEEEYEQLKNEYLSELVIDNVGYRNYLSGIEPEQTHNGYFSIDKKNDRLKDPSVRSSGDSDDVDAYELILKDKERLLSFDEPTRFIFSHSALREGWDNPNVFVMCILKHSDSAISRRQEVGRGLRLCVNQNGERMDSQTVAHDINVLTVVASESYSEFVKGLQGEIADAISSRPRQATEAYFLGKMFHTEQGRVEVTGAMAKQIYRYLLKNDYTDDADQIADAYHQAKESGTLAELPEALKPYSDQVFGLIDSVFSDAQLPEVEDGRASKINPLNENFHKKEFQELWKRINRKAVYRVDFDSKELIEKCVSALDSKLRVTPLKIVVERGDQSGGGEFELQDRSTEEVDSARSIVKYDLVGKIAESSKLTRGTTAAILGGIQPATFDQFKGNPEHFITEASRIIEEQKASMVVEHLAYDETDQEYDVDIFAASQVGQDFSRATALLKKHIYNFAITDSQNEAKFAEELDTSDEVIVYAKLPNGFQIPTPVGDYNPDWAVSFKSGSVRHIYFVAETKGTMSSFGLRPIEDIKVECARKFFRKISERGAVDDDRLKYDVVTGYDKLMDIATG